MKQKNDILKIMVSEFEDTLNVYLLNFINECESDLTDDQLTVMFTGYVLQAYHTLEEKTYETKGEKKALILELESYKKVFDYLTSLDDNGTRVYVGQVAFCFQKEFN